MPDSALVLDSKKEGFLNLRLENGPRSDHPLALVAQKKANIDANVNTSPGVEKFAEFASKNEVQKDTEFSNKPILRSPVTKGDLISPVDILKKFENPQNFNIADLNKNLQSFQTKSNFEKMENEKAAVEIDSYISSLKEINTDFENTINKHKSVLANSNKKEQTLKEKKSPLENAKKTSESSETTESLEDNLQTLNTKIEKSEKNIEPYIKRASVDQAKEMYEQYKKAFSSIEASIVLMSILGKSAQNDGSNNSAIVKQQLNDNYIAMKKRVDECQELIDKAETMKKQMGCIGKIINAVVTIITVVTSVASIFTGGASLVIGALALTLLAADTITEKCSGKSLTSMAMQPIMKGIADIIQSELEAKGVDKKISAAIAMGIAMIIIGIAVIGITMGLGSKLVGNMISKVFSKPIFKAISKSIAKSVPKIISKTASSIKSAVKKITPGNTLNIIRIGNVTLHHTNQVSAASVEVVASHHKMEAGNNTARIKELEFDRDAIKRILDAVGPLLQRIFDSINELQENMTEYMYRLFNNLNSIVKAMKV